MLGRSPAQPVIGRQTIVDRRWTMVHGLRYTDSMSAVNFTPIDDLIKRYGVSQKQSPISLPHEQEPPKRVMTENVTLSESTENKEMPPEVQPYVEVHKDELQLDPDLTKAGLQLADQSSIPPALNIKLPITDDKVIKGLHAPVYTSLRWLATWGQYLLWKAHIQLKTVHGRVIRILKP